MRQVPGRQSGTWRRGRDLCFASTTLNDGLSTICERGGQRARLVDRHSAAVRCTLRAPGRPRSTCMRPLIISHFESSSRWEGVDACAAFCWKYRPFLVSMHSLIVLSLSSRPRFIRVRHIAHLLHPFGRHRPARRDVRGVPVRSQEFWTKQLQNDSKLESSAR